MFRVAALVATASAASVKVDLPVHPERQAEIERVNSAHTSWHAAPNARFAHLPPGASKPLCGVKGDWKKESLLTVDGVEEFVPKNPTAPIPDSFDSAENWPACSKIINDIRDQSACGCCWAFAGAEAASDRMCIATNGKMQVPLSAQDVCFCASMNGCEGGQINTPWSHIKGGLFGGGAVSGGQYQGSGPFGEGLCSDFSLPHCHHHGPVGKDPYPAEGTKGCPTVSSSPRCPSKCDPTSNVTDFKSDKYSFEGSVMTASGEQAIQQMIMEGGPVETAFTVYTDFENYAGGVYKHTSGSMAGGHAVKFVGWGEDNGVKYWKVANSWNPYWGEDGYFRIVRGDDEGNGGIENGVTGSPTDAKWSHGK